MRLRRKFNEWLQRRAANIGEPLYTWVNALVNALRLWRHPERVTHPGELHGERTFYVIGNLSSEVGLAGWYDIVLGYLARAERRGWEPVVVPPKPAQADDGTWTDFFAQPTAVPLAEALKGRNVVWATELGMIHKRYNPRNIELRHRLARRIPFSPAAQAFVEPRLKALFAGAPSPLVAVRFRGTDYRTQGRYCPVGHARVPSMERFCAELERELRRWGVAAGAGEHLLVVTEEAEALEELCRRYPKCRYVVKERYANFQAGQYLVHHRLPTLTPKENNLYYLLEISAMARCDYLFGGVNGGVLMALNLNGNRYRGVRVFDCGVN